MTAGIATRDPDFDPDKPYDEMLVIPEDQRWRIISYDETDTSLDLLNKSKKKKKKSVIIPGDDGDVIGHKASCKITVTGGRNGAGEALAPYVCYSGTLPFHCGERHQNSESGEWEPVVLHNLAKGVDVKPVEPIYAANAKGSMDFAKCLDYTKQISLKSLPGISLTNNCIEFIDGCGCHLDSERIDFMIASGMGSILRVPHSTSKTQGEDTVLYRKLKPDFLKVKKLVHRQKMLRNNNVPLKLTKDDLWNCLAGPWNRAFTFDNLMSAWEHDGFIPFTRKCYWDIRLEEEERARVTREYAEVAHLRVNVGPMEGATGGGNALSRAADEGDASESDADAGGVDNPPHATVARNARTAEPLLKAAAAIPGTSNLDEMANDLGTSPYIRHLREALQIVKSAAAATQANAANPPAIGSTRLTSGVLWGLDGGLTGPAASQMARQKK